jgi:hypothetical protein
MDGLGDIKSLWVGDIQPDWTEDILTPIFNETCTCGMWRVRRRDGACARVAVRRDRVVGARLRQGFFLLLRMVLLLRHASVLAGLCACAACSAPIQYFLQLVAGTAAACCACQACPASSRQ